jgi:hypothetical protein
MQHGGNKIVFMNWTRVLAFLNLFGLACSAAGGLFLVYSLTLKSSNFRLIKVADNELAICLDDKKVVAGYGGPLVVSDGPCPDMKRTGPTPQVIADNPRLATWGVTLIFLGFVLQLPTAIAAVRIPR